MANEHKNVYIFARNYTQAKLCADKNNIHPEDWTFLDSPDRLCGVSRGQLVWYYGNPRERADYQAILSSILERGSVYILAPNHLRDYLYQLGKEKP